MFQYLTTNYVGTLQHICRNYGLYDQYLMMKKGWLDNMLTPLSFNMELRVWTVFHHSGIVELFRWGGLVNFNNEIDHRHIPGGSLDLSISIATTLMMRIHMGQSRRSASDLTKATALRHWHSSRLRSGYALCSSRLTFCWNFFMSNSWKRRNDFNYCKGYFISRDWENHFVCKHTAR